MWLAATLLYLVDFLFDAADAALPASTALCWMYDEDPPWSHMGTDVFRRWHSPNGGQQQLGWHCLIIIIIIIIIINQISQLVLFIYFVS